MQAAAEQEEVEEEISQVEEDDSNSKMPKINQVNQSYEKIKTFIKKSNLQEKLEFT